MTKYGSSRNAATKFLSFSFSSAQNTGPHQTDMTDQCYFSALTPQFLLSQQRGVLQQTQKTRQGIGHSLTKGAALPQGQQTSVSLPQQSLNSLGNMKEHDAQLLEQFTVSGLQRML